MSELFLASSETQSLLGALENLDGPVMERKTARRSSTTSDFGLAGGAEKQRGRSATTSISQAQLNKQQIELQKLKTSLNVVEMKASKLEEEKTKLEEVLKSTQEEYQKVVEKNKILDIQMSAAEKLNQMFKAPAPAPVESKGKTRDLEKKLESLQKENETLKKQLKEKK